MAFSLTLALSAITEFTPKNEEMFLTSDAFRLWRTVNVLIFYGEMQYFATVFFHIYFLAEEWIKPPVGKICISTGLWDLGRSSDKHVLSSEHIDGVFSFLLWGNRRLDWKRYQSHYYTIKQFSQEAFHCIFSKPALSVKGRERCTEKNNLKSLPQDVIEDIYSYDSYFTFYALHSVAVVLHAGHLFGSKQTFGRDRFGLHMIQPWQVFFSPHK